MPQAQVNGQNLYYEVHGEGHPLCLIAGFTSDTHVWMKVLEPLAKNFKVIIFDNRAAGRSSDPEAPFTIEDMAKDTLALLDHLKIERPHLLGHSMGGSIAQTIAHKYPEKINKLVLCCSTSKFQKKNLLTKDFVHYLRGINTPPEKLIENVLPWFYSNRFLENDKAVALIKHLFVNNPHPQSLRGFNHQFDALVKFDSTSWLCKITPHTLIMHGDEDVVCLHDEIVLKREIQNSLSTTFLGCGHIPFIEQPLLFIQKLTSFLL